jgi:hypothetical protein
MVPTPGWGGGIPIGRKENERTAPRFWPTAEVGVRSQQSLGTCDRTKSKYPALQTSASPRRLRVGRRNFCTECVVGVNERRATHARSGRGVILRPYSGMRDSSPPSSVNCCDGASVSLRGCRLAVQRACESTSAVESAANADRGAPVSLSHPSTKPARPPQERRHRVGKIVNAFRLPAPSSAVRRTLPGGSPASRW